MFYIKRAEQLDTYQYIILDCNIFFLPIMCISLRPNFIYRERGMLNKSNIKLKKNRLFNIDQINRDDDFSRNRAALVHDVAQGAFINGRFLSAGRGWWSSALCAESPWRTTLASCCPRLHPSFPRYTQGFDWKMYSATYNTNALFSLGGNIRSALWTCVE